MSLELIGLYKEIIDVIDCPVVVFEKSGRIKFLNSSFKSLFNLPSNSFTENVIDDFIHQGSLKKFKELQNNCGRNEETDYREIILGYDCESIPINVKIKKTDSFFIMAGIAVDPTTESLQNELITLNSESNNLNRELNKKTVLLQKKNEELEELYQRIDDEVNKAAKVHKRVFPAELPQTDKISIAGYNQPATQMGGDSYNVIRSGDKMVIYVADVMGHGLDGAMLSLFIQEAIESYVSLKPDELTPQKILKHLDNQYRRHNFPDEQLIAIFLSILDLNTNELSYSSAGFQTKPLVLMGDGSRIVLETKGLFIGNGIPPELMNFKESTLTLTPGTTIMIGSDGLPEHDNGAGLYEDRYHEIFYRHAHLPPEIIMQAINKDFFYFNQNSMVGLDDITYLVLQYGKSL